MITYKENMKYAYFNGLKFTRDDRTGYYLNSTNRLRLHRAVWEFYNGKIPPCMQVHHKDKDLTNNDISNFELVPFREHQKYHGESITQQERDWRKDNINENARPKAIEWHKSPEGREWHKKHYENTKDRLKEKRAFTCERCGRAFTSSQAASRFCSNACKSAWRRAQGLDNEERACAYCGCTFIANKYKQQIYCSKACSCKGAPRLPAIRKNTGDTPNR